MKKKRKALPKQYDAPKGSSRAKKIRKASKLYKSGNKSAAYAIRDKMEAKVRRKRAKSKSKTK